MVYIYILQLSEGKYYIGKSQYPDIRLESHNSGKGSAWTKKYPQVKVIKVISDCDDFDEDKYTKIYMQEYGIDNVRGGSYCQIILSKETKVMLLKELRGAEDKCFNCGNPGHFIGQCPSWKKSAKVKVCSRCKRKGHLSNRCYAKKDKDGEPLSDIFCDRCWRKGHLSYKCYARTDIEGNPLQKRESEKRKSTSNQPFSPEEESSGQMVIKDLICSRCGRKGHLLDQCYAKTDQEDSDLINQSDTNKIIKQVKRDKSFQCFRCRRYGHRAGDCYAKTDIDGNVFQQKKSKKDESFRCFRCKRYGHRAEDCYAKTDFKERRITWNGCTNCGRKSHNAIRCGKSVDVFGNPVEPALLPVIWSGITNFFGS